MTPPLAALACLLLLSGIPAKAQQPAPIGGTVRELLEYADLHNPDLIAARYEREAAQARVQPAGALNDPMFEVELRDMDRDLNRVGSVKYTFAQPLPFWGKRDLRAEVAESGARAAQGEERAAATEIHERIKTAFAQYYQIRESTRLNTEIFALMLDLERVAQVRFANGLAPQQDVIKAQVEQTMIKSELIALETEAVHIRGRINSLLNRPAEAPLTEPRGLRPAPPLADLDMEMLEQRLRATNPLLFAQSARVAGSEANRRLVERNRYPDFVVGVSPIQADDRLAAWEARVSINIPLQQETRRSQEREADALVNAARARQEAVASRLLNELHQALATWEAARRQELLILEALLPQAAANYQSALVGYENGNVDFATLLEAERQVKRARLDRLKVQVEQESRLAQIERMIGGNL